MTLWLADDYRGKDFTLTQLPALGTVWILVKVQCKKSADQEDKKWR